ncbi:MAG TPA: glycoside hydrolase domain-containing protein [bacterium]|nr:glycoside hydrolase domain-containing protein [bacterium]
MKTRLAAVMVAGGLFLLCLPVPGLGQSLTWWTEPATHKVMQDRPPQPTRAVAIEAARNEYEPFQVVLRADGGDLDNVHAWMSDLAGPAGARIPALNVILYRAYYVSVTQTSGNSVDGDGVPGDPREPGEYVDPLIPFYDPYHPTHYAVGTPFDIPQNRLQPIFGDVYVPTGVPAGDYHGTLTVTVNFTAAAQVPVTLRVWNFTLPFERRVATSYGLSFGKILWYHGGSDGQYDDESLRIIRNYEEVLHRFRIDITNVIQTPPYLPSPFFSFDADDKILPPDYSAFDAHLEDRFSGAYYDDGVGMTMVNQQLFAPGNASTLETSLTDDEYIQAAAEFARHLKEKGWWDRIYVYVHDEPGLYPGAMQAVAYDVALTRLGDPDWVSRMMATNHWVKELQYSIGIWCPLTSSYDKWNWSVPEYTREDYQRLIAGGKVVWFYVCNGTHPPYAGYDIDTIYGHEPRFLQWQSWYEGATGFLYWSTNYWMWSDPWGTLLDLDTWPSAARTGDGFLVYPGDHNGTAVGKGSPDWLSLDGPVISYRLMMIREGMEDWDYLLLCQDRGGKAFAKNLMQGMYTQFGMAVKDYDPDNQPWTYDETQVYDARHALALFISGAFAGGNDDGGGGGGCAVAGPGEGRGAAGFLIMLAALAGVVAVLRVNSRRLFLILALLTGFSLAGCGPNADDDDGAALPAAPRLNHSFINGASGGQMPGQMSGSGPVITKVNMVPGSMVIQAQTLLLNITFNDLENDLASPTLFLQLRGQPECWTFGPDQFGGILGNVATVQVEVDRYFEPDSYVLRLALMDDAGNVGNIFSALLTVIPYATPEILALVPEDGATAVVLNASVRGLFSNPVVGVPPTLTLTRNNIAVPSSIRLLPSIKGITLVPAEFLLPLTEYVATLTVGDLNSGIVRQEVHAFTTAGAIPAPDITGRVYSIDLAAGAIIEPTGAEILFAVLPIPPILVKVTEFDPAAGAIGSVAALGTGNPLGQDPLMPLMSFPGQTAILDNPYFSMGPTILNIDLGALTGGLYDFAINVYDFTLSGHYNPDGTRFEDAIVTGYIDSQEVNDAFNQFAPATIPFDACITLPDSCDPDGHLAFRAENLAGNYEPQIEDLYDLSLSPAPAAITGSAGGSVIVTVEFIVNEDPSGSHLVTLSTDYGTLSCGGASCSVTTVNGTYQVTLTLPPGRPAGQNITVTGSVASPIGNITRKAEITVN